MNRAFPDTEEYVNRPLMKADVGRLVDAACTATTAPTTEEILDNLKNLGFHYATRAGVTLGVEDVTTPPDKQKILDSYETRASKIETQYKKGIITDDERRQELIEIWTQATDEVKDAMEAQFGKTNPIYMMANSGARGNIMQIRQIAGHARPGGQPEGRDHPASDQVELPRGPVGARVLHLDARRAQGPGRHGAADGRLRATSRGVSSTSRRS